MARINIEDSIYKDNRFLQLCMKTQSVDAAIGGLVRAWSLGQVWYLTKNKMIPVAEWRKQKINDLIIDVGLAHVEGEFIKIDGAEEQFSWLVQRSVAGKKSVASKKSKKEKNSTVVQRSLTTVESRSTKPDGSQPLSLSLPPTLSHSSGSSCGEPQRPHFFQTFVIDVMKTMDTGLILLAPKVEKAFVNEAGFNAWVDQVTGSKAFDVADANGQLRYFTKALKDELKLRGVIS